MKTVYLAGPIAGLTYEGATDWRDRATVYLSNYSIQGRSPLRGKDFLQSVGVLGTQSYNQHPLSSQDGVTTRDRFDCTTSDVVLFNFLGVDTVSVGSCIELGWADGARRPIVIAMEEPHSTHNLLNPDEKIVVGMNPHDHPIVRGVAGFIVPTIEEALQIVVSILG